MFLPPWASWSRACAKFSLSCGISRSTSKSSSRRSKHRTTARVLYARPLGKLRNLSAQRAEYPSPAFVGLCPPHWFRDLGIFPTHRAVPNFVLQLRRHLSMPLQLCRCQRRLARQHHPCPSRPHLGWLLRLLRLWPLRRPVQLPVTINVVTHLARPFVTHRTIYQVYTREVFNFEVVVDLRRSVFIQLSGCILFMTTALMA